MTKLLPLKSLRFRISLSLSTRLKLGAESLIFTFSLIWISVDGFEGLNICRTRERESPLDNIYICYQPFSED